MPDVFESRCLPELLEMEVNVDAWEDAIEEERDEDIWAEGAWDDGFDEMDEKPDVTAVISEQRDRILLLLCERLLLLHSGAVLRQIPLSDPSSLLYTEEIEGKEWEAVERAMDEFRLLISELVVDTYVSEIEDDLPSDLVSEAMRSEGGVEAQYDPDTEFTTHDIVHGYLVSRLQEYFETLAREAGER